MPELKDQVTRGGFIKVKTGRIGKSKWFLEP